MKHDNSPFYGFLSTIIMIFAEVITVSGIVSTIFYAALGVGTGWLMQYGKKIMLGKGKNIDPK